MAPELCIFVKDGMDVEILDHPLLNTAERCDFLFKNAEERYVIGVNPFLDFRDSIYASRGRYTKVEYLVAPFL